jgi:tetratricopeptide (TPR) repeat protein
MSQTILKEIEVFKAAASLAERFVKKGDNFSLAIAGYLVREYDTAISILREDLGSSTGGKYEAQLALCYFREGHMEEAEGWIRKAIAADNKGVIRAHILERDLPYISILGQILLALGQAEKADAAAKSALKQFPDDVLALTTKGMARMAIGDLKEAKDRLSAALDRAKGSPSAVEIKKYLDSVQQLLDNQQDGIPASVPIGGMSRVNEG